MCVIFVLNPGFTLPLEMLKNACYNNPHGFGIVFKRAGSFEVMKELPEGGNDPDVIYKLLKDNEDAQRFVHVRWKTQGAISLENTQPFTVYDDGETRIEFMHNGTLSSYGPPVGYQHSQVSFSQISDSKDFADKVLTKYLPKLCGDNGVADIEDEMVQQILDKYWSGGSKGVLICNRLDPFYFGKSSWEDVDTSEIVNGEEVKGSFYASNNDYFERLKRGPLFEKRETERKKKEEEAKKTGTNVSTKTEGSVVGSSPEFFSRYALKEKVSDILEDYDMYEAEGYIALSNLTYYEMLRFCATTDSDDLASMFLYLTDFLMKNTTALIEANNEIKRLTQENDNSREGVQSPEVKTQTPEDESETLAA